MAKVVDGRKRVRIDADKVVAVRVAAGEVCAHFTDLSITKVLDAVGNDTSLATDCFCMIPLPSWVDEMRI